MSFSDDAETPQGTSVTDCYANQLAQATPHNKGYLKSYVSSINEEDATEYSKGLQAAFDLFMDTPNATVIEERSMHICVL